MKQVRLAGRWLKQKSKLLPVVMAMVFVGTLFSPALIPRAHAIVTNDTGGGSSGIAKWADEYKTLVWQGEKFTGGSGSNAVFKAPKDDNGCTDQIKFDSDYKTATSATLVRQNFVLQGGGLGSVCQDAPDFSLVIDKTPSNPDALTPTTENNASTDDLDPCDASTNPLSWIVCPIIGLVNEGVIQMQNVIDNLMKVDIQSVFDNKRAPGKNYYAAWNSFRLFGVVLIVIAGLVMVISQAMGFDIFDAYTVKKVLPRLFVAAIGISLSWWLMKYLAQFTNDLGLAIRSIIYYPFRNMGGAGLQSTGSFVISAIIGAAALWALQPFGVMLLIGTAFLAAFVAFLVLIARQLVLIFLILMAPLAIACYVLPNTEKMYKIWWDSLFKGLLMFPIISGFIAIGRVFSVVAANTSSGAGSSINQVVALIAFFLPYFALPFTFRLAGGAVATIGGLTNDRSRGAFDRLKKGRSARVEKRMGHVKDKYGSQMLQGKASVVRGLNARASRSGRVGGAVLRTASRRVQGMDNLEAQMSALNAQRGKELGDQIATGIDSEVRGLTVNRKAALADFNKNPRKRTDNADGSYTLTSSQGLYKESYDKNGQLVSKDYTSLGGGSVSEADVINGHRRWGNDVAAQQAALSYEMRKAMTDDQVEGVSQRYIDLAKNDWGQTETQAVGSWIGAGFENQNQHLEFKNTDLDYSGGTAKLNAKKFANEAYEKKGSYQLSQMSAHTIKKMSEAYVAGDDETKQKLRAVSETFMHDMYGGGGRQQIAEHDGAPMLEPDMPAPIPGTPEAAAAAKKRQASSQGSGHVAEAVVAFAKQTGAYDTAPTMKLPNPSNPPESPGNWPTPDSQQK
jgi:hypothetical protein